MADVTRLVTQPAPRADAATAAQRPDTPAASGARPCGAASSSGQVGALSVLPSEGAAASTSAAAPAPCAVTGLPVAIAVSAEPDAATTPSVRVTRSAAVARPLVSPPQVIKRSTGASGPLFDAGALAATAPVSPGTRQAPSALFTLRDLTPVTAASGAAPPDVPAQLAGMPEARRAEGATVSEASASGERSGRVAPTSVQSTGSRGVSENVSGADNTVAELGDVGDSGRSSEGHAQASEQPKEDDRTLGNKSKRRASPESKSMGCLPCRRTRRSSRQAQPVPIEPPLTRGRRSRT